MKGDETQMWNKLSTHVSAVLHTFKARSGKYTSSIVTRISTVLHTVTSVQLNEVPKRYQ